MSGYPSTNPYGYPSNHPAYPVNTLPPQPYSNALNPSGYPLCPYPNTSTNPYPNQQPGVMRGDIQYLAAPSVSSPYLNAGGNPASGNVPDFAGTVPNPEFNPAFCPSAPDLSQMEKIPGYEKLTFEEEIATPPTVPDWKPENSNQVRKEIENLPSLTEEDAREALIQYVSEHCCYGSGAAKKMSINDIAMISAVHYQLETFGEKRKTAWRFDPYNGQDIDGPENGPAPLPWDIMAKPSGKFKDSTKKYEVPHTAYVKPCHTCVGNGRIRCSDCTGYGKSKCTSCRGRGKRRNLEGQMTNCTCCDGTGSRRCSCCAGMGQVKCKTCDGHGQLKAYVELTVTWKNHVDDFISKTSGMPKELVHDVTGQTAFTEENPRVSPIMNAADEAVRNASKKFITKHSTAFPNERILKQRQRVRLIPIAKVNYKWKEETGVFYVYGYEHKVYFEKYPQSCCCCSIL